MAAVDAVYTAIGAALAVLTAGGSVVCLDFWGNRRRSAPCLLALHFCLSLGLLAGPAIVDPLSHARVPYLVQSRLKMPVGLMCTYMQSSVIYESGHDSLLKNN